MFEKILLAGVLAFCTVVIIMYRLEQISPKVYKLVSAVSMLCAMCFLVSYTKHHAISARIIAEVSILVAIWLILLRK